VGDGGFAGADHAGKSDEKGSVHGGIISSITEPIDILIIFGSIVNMTIKQQVIELRREGKTYGEIQNILGVKIAKSTLSYWCKLVELPDDYQERVSRLLADGLNKSRAAALAKKQENREKHREELIKQYGYLKEMMKDKDVALIALAMLCLGEAGKSEGLYLGSSDPRIIKLFLGLLRRCFDFDIEKTRGMIMCRADHNIQELETYWQEVSGIPKRLFYKTRIDPRTVGKATLNKEYRGVLRVDYYNAKIQKELKVLYNLLAESV
jgi:hypothetical protein